MIRYALQCEAGHEFESWFPDSASYDKQRKRGLIACPHCQSTRVEKQIMAPALASKKEKPAQTVAMIGEKERELRQMIQALHSHMRENAENVGDNFAEEARKIHYGETEERAIYGAATPPEAKALIEEGIPVLPVPALPDDMN